MIQCRNGVPARRGVDDVSRETFTAERRTAPQVSGRLASLALLVLAVSGILLTACTSVASPKGWASPVQSDDLLLISHRDDLFALDPETLIPRWAFPTASDDIDPEALYGTPAVMGDTVFVPTYEGSLYALDIENGQLLPGWPFETDGPLIGGVAVASDTVYFGSDDGNVYALNATTGVERWAQPFETGEAVWSTPALAGDTLYVTSLDGKLYAINAATGSERWSFSTDAGIASPPVVNQGAGLVYIGGLDSKLRAIDLETHEERWSLEADNWFWTEPLLAAGSIFAGSLDGNVYAINAVSGEARWPQPFSAGEPVRAAPIVVGDTLIVIDREGNVHGVDMENGSRTLGPTALESDVFSDPLLRRFAGSDEIIVVTTDGELVSIDPATLRVLDSRKL